MEVVFAVEAVAHAGAHPTAPPGALPGAGLGDRLDRQALQLGAVAVAADAGETGIHDVTDVRHRQAGFGDVGGQHHAPPAGGSENARLLRRRQPGVEGQDVESLREVAFEQAGAVENLAFAGLENEDVAPRRRRVLGDGFQALHQGRFVVGFGGVLAGAGIHGAVDDLHGMAASRHLHHRRAAEVVGESGGVDGGAGDHHLEIRSAGEQALQAAEEEVHVEAALVRLVHDHAFVAAKPRVPLHFGEQQTVGQHAHAGGGARPVVEAHRVAHFGAQSHAQFFGDAGRHRPRRQPPRLGVGDHAPASESRRQARLGQLRRFAGTGLANHDDHPLGAEQRDDAIDVRRYRQLGRELRFCQPWRQGDRRSLRPARHDFLQGQAGPGSTSKGNSSPLPSRGW